MNGLPDVPVGAFLTLFSIPLLFFIGVLVIIAIVLTLILGPSKETFLERKARERDHREKAHKQQQRLRNIQNNKR